MKFVAPEMEMKLFSTEDILTASSPAATEPVETTKSLYQPSCKAELPLD